MRPGIIAICEHVDRGAYNKSSLSSIFSVIIGTELPVVHKRLILFCLCETTTEKQGDHIQVEATLHNPQDEVILQGGFKAEIGSSISDDIPFQPTFVVECEGIVFNQVGKHVFKLKVDGKVIDETNLYVRVDKEWTQAPTSR